MINIQSIFEFNIEVKDILERLYREFEYRVVKGKPRNSDARAILLIEEFREKHRTTLLSIPFEDLEVYRVHIHYHTAIGWLDAERYSIDKEWADALAETMKEDYKDNEATITVSPIRVHASFKKTKNIKDGKA